MATHHGLCIAHHMINFQDWKTYIIKIIKLELLLLINMVNNGFCVFMQVWTTAGQVEYPWSVPAIYVTITPGQWQFIWHKCTKYKANVLYLTLILHSFSTENWLNCTNLGFIKLKVWVKWHQLLNKTAMWRNSEHPWHRHYNYGTEVQ